MEARSEEVARLLAGAPEYLPLSQGSLQMEAAICRSGIEDAALIFGGARHPQAAQAGLLFRLGCWEESHAVAQDIVSAEGSYWHGMLHRIEPDSSNAKYWFRQLGAHPIFPQLLHLAQDLMQTGGPQHWRLKGSWDPFLFIDWCEEARTSGGPAETTAIQIQMAEWQLLFDWCIGPEWSS